MKNFCLSPALFLQLGLFLSTLLLFSPHVGGQCTCDSDSNVYPSGPNDQYYYPSMDANGFVTSYNYRFKFHCITDPLPPGGQYEYKILYREKGTGPWTIVGSTLYSGNPLFTKPLIGVNKLEPCKTYEFRATCPDCILGLFCDAQDQLDAYLDDEENNALNNVTSIWEVCYSPIDWEPINNFILKSLDMDNGTATLSWDHLPTPANYNIEYREKNSFVWIPAGTTNQYEFALTNLEACAEYVVRIRGAVDNCCGEAVQYSQYASFTFMMNDCMSNIKTVDFVTGNSAQVTWAPIGSDPVPYEYELHWWKNPNDPHVTATVSSTNYTITGLQPNTAYSVQVFSKCSPQICTENGYSKKVNLTTNCELNEPNNTFQSATPIAFDANHTNSNITPGGDIDYYKFTPTYCQIEIKIDRPDYEEFVYGPGGCYLTTGLSYVLYDQNHQEVPKAPEYVDSQNCIHTNTYWVTPGQEYYLAINGGSEFYQNLNCYTFNVFPCLGCGVANNLSINGTDNIYAIPETKFYGLSQTVYQVEWSVSGPADITSIPIPEFCQLSFYDVGTVVLTATVTYCDGAVDIVQKEITVSDECNISGSYTNAHQGGLLNEGFNFVSSQNFVITLDLPPGVSFSVYQNGGSSSWVIDDNKIMVTQVGSVSSIRIALSGGNCTGTEGVYFFIKWPSGPLKPPVEWSISPNPTSNLLQISPVVLPGVDPSTVPSSLDIRLFNQNSNLVQSHQGTTLTPASLNLGNLQPGSYSLQLLYGDYWQQYTVIKQ